jgi:DNA-binding NtrC family response regulator
MGSPDALIVDAPSPARLELGQALSAIGCRASYATVSDAVTVVERRRPAIVILSARESDATAEIACLRAIRTAVSFPPVLFLASASSEDLAIAAFRSGAQQYVRAPWTAALLQAAVIDLLPVCAPPDVAPPLEGGELLVGRSAAMRDLRTYLARVGPVPSNVLILGETGTGKELVADLIHRNSRRASGPFVCLNTAAIPDSLLENELFGHERGAFTGAASTQVGKLAAATHGTLFLDEIGEVSQLIQAKLLRVIESKAMYRLGGTRSIDVDVRIVAATNNDIDHAVQQGSFRKDLYYRLNVIRVELAPLRQRQEDIPVLIDYYLGRFNRELGRSVTRLSSGAMDMLRGYHWPGNVRELKNVVEALLVNLAPETTGVVDVPPQVMRQLALALAAPVSERDRLLQALVTTNWNKSRAATQLHCSRMTLYRKMHRYNVTSEPDPTSGVWSLRPGGPK